MLQIKFAVAAAIGLKTLGGIFFILGSSIGAILLVSTLRVFFTTMPGDIDRKTYLMVSSFFCSSCTRQFLHQSYMTSITTMSTKPNLHNYLSYSHRLVKLARLFTLEMNRTKPECLKLSKQMVAPLQNLALAGALFFFIGMKNSLPRRTHKKKTVVKAKTG